MTAKDEILALKKELNTHNYNYYVLDNPTISDFEYDKMLYRLIELENENPELITPDSPSQRIGGKPLSEFKQVNHEYPLESLMDVFSFDELKGFNNRIIESGETPEYTVEPKIDGLSVALEYIDGIFVRGATRGNGLIGEDVTENLRTINSIPLKLPQSVPHLIVRGEVFMPKKVFDKINEMREINGEQLFANPRNAAAGSLRQLDPKVAASRKLDIIIFNVQNVNEFNFTLHSESLNFVKDMQFKTIQYEIVTSFDECQSRIEWIGEHRNELEYDIDGAVVKLNALQGRSRLGSTAKAPRWAVAYKYPPEKKESVIKDIVVQVGRTGVLTPKAIIEPVRLAGTTVTNATLHNQDFITDKDIRIGDTVLVQKAGEIIPEVLEVIKSKRPAGTVPYKLPSVCPVCGAEVVRDTDGAAMRCIGAECPAQLLRNITHFASKGAMDIDGLGIAIVTQLVDSGLIKSAADLYYLEPQAVASLDRMGKKSSENLIDAIENSKENDLSNLIYALGIRQVGQKAAKVLASNYSTMAAIENADVESLTELDDIGPIIAKNIVEWFADPQSRHLLMRLKNAGVNMESKVKQAGDIFSGKTFVITGTLENYTRDQAGGIIESLGGKVSSSVSKKTSYVLVGENPGSKLTKAQGLGISIINEAEFNNMIQQ